MSCILKNFCSRCGKIGTQKALKLEQKCEPKKAKRSVTFLEASFHVHGVVFLLLRPFVARAWEMLLCSTDFLTGLVYIGPLGKA